MLLYLSPCGTNCQSVNDEALLICKVPRQLRWRYRRGKLTLAAAMQPGTLDSSTLSPQQIAQMNALLDELLDLPGDQRIDALRRRAVDDTQVAAAVERWRDAV